jgi:hypothetical protein
VSCAHLADFIIEAFADKDNKNGNMAKSVIVTAFFEKPRANTVKRIIKNKTSIKQKNAVA